MVEKPRKVCPVVGSIESSSRSGYQVPIVDSTQLLSWELPKIELSKSMLVMDRLARDLPKKTSKT